MPDKTDLIAQLSKQRILPLFYHDEAETCISMMRSMYAAGIRIIEFTNRGGAALENFVAMRHHAAEHFSDLILGIGTIKNEKEAERFVAADAAFFIAPSMNEAVGAVAARHNIPWIPGCLTPTEIAAAENAGAAVVKIFPGNLLGPAYIKSLRDIFPVTRFVVTGGVEPEAENLRGWFDAGVAAVGMGSKLIDNTLIAQKDFDGLTRSISSALQTAQNI